MNPAAASFQRQRCLAGLVCLLTFLLGASGISTEFCALLASLDRSHTPLAGLRHEGGVVVLSHSKRAATLLRQENHRHGPLARSLCVLESRKSAQSDHLLEFATARVNEASERSARLVTRNLQVHSRSECPSIDLKPDDAFAAWQAAADQPRAADLLRSHRSTVLLI